MKTFHRSHFIQGVLPFWTGTAVLYLFPYRRPGVIPDIYGGPEPAAESRVIACRPGQTPG